MIPARQGSKRLPGKNIRILNGRPLISYTIQAALQSQAISKTVVTTDSEEILELSIREGCEQFPLRPSEFAQDQTSSLELIRFELERFQSLLGDVDFIVLLQPTSPLRTAHHIDQAVRLFETSGAQTLTSITPTTILATELWKKNGTWIEQITEQRTSDSETTDSIFRENGAIYILSSDDLKNGRFYGDRIVGYEMSAQRSIDIDTLTDFDSASEFLKSNPL